MAPNPLLTFTPSALTTSAPTPDVAGPPAAPTAPAAPAAATTTETTVPPTPTTSGLEAATLGPRGARLADPRGGGSRGLGCALAVPTTAVGPEG